MFQAKRFDVSGKIPRRFGQNVSAFSPKLPDLSRKNMDLLHKRAKVCIIL